MRAAATVGFLILVLLFRADPVAAQKPTNEDCLACHRDAGLAHDVNGKRVTLYVDPVKFKNSMHGGMFACVIAIPTSRLLPTRPSQPKFPVRLATASNKRLTTAVCTRSPFKGSSLRPPAPTATAALMSCCP